MIQLKLRRVPQVLVVEFIGKLDMSTVNQLGKIEKEDVSQISKVIFCFAQLQFIDSTGIGEILRLQRLFAQKRIKFQIRNQNPEIDDALNIVGLKRLLD